MAKPKLTAKELNDITKLSRRMMKYSADLRKKYNNYFVRNKVNMEYLVKIDWKLFLDNLYELENISTKVSNTVFRIQ